MQQDPGSEFWTWCLDAYARTRVARAVLRLQDRNGACVMVLLCLCWRAGRGIADDAAGVARLAACADRIERHSLAPLRAGRRVLANAGRALPGTRFAAAARTAIVAELALERGQARRLAQCAGVPAAPGTAPREAARRALEQYLRSLGLRPARARSVAQLLACRTLAR